MLCSSSKRDDVILAFIERPLTKDARPARARAERAWRGRRQGRAETGARADRTAERGKGAAVLAGRVRAASVRAGRARRDRRGAGADRRPRGGGRQQTGGCGCAGGKRAGAERPRPRAGADRRGAGADRRPGGVADSRRSGAGADRRTADHWGAQTADGRALVQTADRRRGRRRQTAREQTAGGHRL